MKTYPSSIPQVAWLLPLFIMMASLRVPTASAQTPLNYLLVENRQDMTDAAPFILNDGIFVILTDGRRINGTLARVSDVSITIRGAFNKSEEVDLESVAVVGKRGLPHTIFRWIGGLNIITGVPFVILGSALLQNDTDGLGGVLGFVFVVIGGAGTLTGTIPFLVPRKRFPIEEYSYVIRPMPK